MSSVSLARQGEYLLRGSGCASQHRAREGKPGMKDRFEFWLLVAATILVIVILAFLFLTDLVS